LLLQEGMPVDSVPKVLKVNGLPINGLPDMPDIPTIASVPSPFGTLSSVQVRLGDPGDTGTKQTFIFETPSLNSLIYTSMS